MVLGIMSHNQHHSGYEVLDFLGLISYDIMRWNFLNFISTYTVGDAEKDANCRKFMERAMPECFQKVIKMLDNFLSFNTIKALLSPWGAYLIFGFQREGLIRERGLLERGLISKIK